MRSERRPANADHLDARADVTGPALRWGLAIAVALPFAALVVLYAAGVPLGCPGRFVYLYSPVTELRLLQVPEAVLIAFVLAWSAWRLNSPERRHRLLAGLLLVVATLALGVWTYVAPPGHERQHVFNAASPSHDGAFLLEAKQISDVHAYLADFPQRARTPPTEMRGTRVISNPPGVTLFALAVEHAVARWPWLGERLLGAAGSELSPADRYISGVGITFLAGLTVLWLLSAVVLYALGRLFFAPPVAVVYSLCCVFTPATLLFTPGKDPAQLLTAAVPLYLWLVAVRRGSLGATAAAGATLVLACVVSLVHVWLAAILVVATGLALSRSHHPRLRWLLIRGVPAAGVAAVLVAVVLRLISGLDVLATARAVAAAQAEITRGPNAMPLHWQILGVPLFLLFAGPALWAVAIWVASGGCKSAPESSMPAESATLDRAFGRWLLIASAAVMLATVGFTNIETPRLWIPFMPLLLLGGMLQCTALVQPSRRTTVMLALLAFFQIAVAAAQWSLMDPRETETRLVVRRFWS